MHLEEIIKTANKGLKMFTSVFILTKPGDNWQVQQEGND